MIPSAPPVIVRSTNFVLGTVTLPAPVVNDTKTQQVTRINRVSRGLKRRVFRSDDWYSLISYDYIFRNVTLAKKNAFVTFVRTTAGDSFTVTDHLSQVKTMYIVEVGPISEVHNDQCSYSFSVVLQQVI